MTPVAARVSRLRSHHELASRALRTKIEMRINRVPKKHWNAKVRDLRAEVNAAVQRAEHVGNLVAQNTSLQTISENKYVICSAFMIFWNKLTNCDLNLVYHTEIHQICLKEICPLIEPKHQYRPLSLKFLQQPKLHLQ